MASFTLFVSSLSLSHIITLSDSHPGSQVIPSPLAFAEGLFYFKIF